jgi:hypothetical protein
MRETQAAEEPRKGKQELLRNEMGMRREKSGSLEKRENRLRRGKVGECTEMRSENQELLRNRNGRRGKIKSFTGIGQEE